MKSYHHLSCEERRIIYRLKREQKSIRFIANTLARSPSTISRELKRNTGGCGYNCYEADGFATWRKIRNSRSRKKIREEHFPFILECLESKFSPEQIAALFPKKFGFSIVTSSLYRWIHRYHDGGRFQLRKKLRRKGKPYRKSKRRGPLPPRTFIDERPESVASKRFYGEWEADLMQEGKNYILVLVERKSLYTLIKRIANRKSYTVSKAIIAALKPFRVRSITYDNGAEFARFEEVENASKSKAYFCHPYSAWEKGLVENTIGLIREYFPKGSGQLPEDQAIFDSVQKEINSRPRKCIQFKNPNQLLRKIQSK